MRCLAAVLALLLLAGAGCGGSDDTSADEPAATTEAAATTAAEQTEPLTEPEPPPVDEQPAEPLPGLPDELAGYDAWAKLNAEPIPPRESDPHHGTKNVYASKAAEGGTYPDGAIVVKEATRPGADFIGLVAMMRKERGAQPDHNDWVWVEWVRDGPDEEFRELASGAVCYSCHAGARERDYVFTR